MLRTSKRDAVAAVLVHVELGEPHAPRHLRRQLVEHRRDHPARPAPRRPQVEHHRQRRVLDLGRERGIGDRDRPVVGR